MLLRLIVATIAIAWTSVASAQMWHYEAGEDDPFKGGRERIAMVSDGIFLAGFRCTSKDDLAMVFIVNEKPPLELLPRLTLGNWRLLVVIDDDGKDEFSAELQITPDGDRLRLEATAEQLRPLVARVQSAKRRIAIAGEFNGKVIWSRAFATSGSRRAIDPLITGCKLVPRAS